MILNKNYKRKTHKQGFKECLSAYNVQASSFLQLQKEGKSKLAHKEKSTLESLLPLVAVSLTPFALQAQSCPNNAGVLSQCVNPEIQTIDLEGDNTVDLEIHSTFGSTSDLGAIVRVEQSSNWLSSGYLVGNYFYFNAFQLGDAITAAGISNPLQPFLSNGSACGNITSHYGWLDYDPTGGGASVGEWNGQTGSTPGLYMGFKKDGILGFVELIYDDATNIVTVGNYGLACDASVTSILAGDCSSLIGASISIGLEITEDVNNDGTILSSECSGNIDVRVTLPASASAGDMLAINDGINPPITISLTAGDVTQGFVLSTVPTPTNGTTLTVTGILTSGCSSGSASDVAVIDITTPLSITIAEDANNDGTVDAAECSGAIDILVILPNTAVAGDMLAIDDGINPPITITLTATDITAGNVSTSVPLPPNGTNLTVTGTLSSNCNEGNGNDVALIDISIPLTVTISEDINNDGIIDLSESSGAVDVEVTLPAAASVGDMLLIDDGNGTQITITLNAGHITQGVVFTSVQLPADGSTLTVTGTLNTGCSVGTGADVAVINLIPPPSNDDCSTPSLTPVKGCCSPSMATLTGATISPETSSGTCGTGGPATGKDVWFRITVPASGHVIARTSAITGGVSDTVLEAYSGTCGSLVTESCNDDDPSGGLYSVLDMPGLTPGIALLIRARSYNGTEEGDFGLCFFDGGDRIFSGTIAFNADYESDNAIESTQVIDPPANVDYDSAIEIELNPNFEVRTGAIFHAFIDGCVGNGL